MFFQEVFVSQMNAQELANIVAAFLRGEHEGRYFKLIAVSKDQSTQHELWVRPSYSANMNPVVPTEQVMCVTDDGREVHLIIPSTDRDTTLALVLIGEPLPDGSITP